MLWWFKVRAKKTTGHAASFIRLLNHDAQDFMWKKLSLLFGSISHFHRTIDIIDTIFEHWGWAEKIKQKVFLTKSWLIFWSFNPLDIYQLVNFIGWNLHTKKCPCCWSKIAKSVPKLSIWVTVVQLILTWGWVFPQKWPQAPQESGNLMKCEFKQKKLHPCSTFFFFCVDSAVFLIHRLSHPHRRSSCFGDLGGLDATPASSYDGIWFGGAGAPQKPWLKRDGKMGWTSERGKIFTSLLRYLHTYTWRVNVLLPS